MNKNDLVILGLLLEKPKHGYEIIQDVKNRKLDHWANINVASIYNHLASLETQAAVTAAVEKVGKTPERKVFTITDRGRERLAEQAVLAVKEMGVIEDLPSLGVAFIYGAQREVMLGALKEKLQLYKEAYKQIEQEYHNAKEPIPYNWGFLARKTLDHFKVEIKYFQELIREVKKKDFLKRNFKNFPKEIIKKLS